MKTNLIYGDDAKQDRSVVVGALLASLLLTAGVIASANALSNSQYRQAKLATTLIVPNASAKPTDDVIIVTATRLLPKLVNASTVANTTRQPRIATPS
jgi:hypothetical protein